MNDDITYRCVWDGKVSVTFDCADTTKEGCIEYATKVGEELADMIRESVELNLPYVHPEVKVERLGYEMRMKRRKE